MSARLGKHDTWTKLFDKLKIKDRVSELGYFDISSDQIKDLTGSEARLVAKIDFENSLPRAMRAEKLSILAIENGLYRIAKTNPFVELPVSTSKAVLLDSPNGFDTVDPFDISSESMALDVAKIAGMMDTTFGEKTELTIRGRLRKGAKFEFELGATPYQVNGVQIEVDGGYEGATSVNLLEAKLGTIDNLSIRQLLYPKLAWENILKGKKKVMTYAFTYEKSIFRFVPFEKSEGGFYFDTAKERTFKFKDRKAYDLHSIRLSASPEMNFEAPFPQANSFDTILVMIKKLHQAGGEIAAEEFLEAMWDYGLKTPRQIQYYFDCISLLKLGKKERKGPYQLSGKGMELALLPTKELSFSLAQIIFSEKVFHKALREGVDSITTDNMPPYWRNMGESTFDRRMATVRSWIDWFKTVFDN